MVSIIIPTFNYAEFIGDAIHSVKTQSLGDWECIIIDDCSTDDTAHVVGKLIEGDDRFRYIRLEQNSGVSAARNRGLKECKGKYIQFLDADDVIAPMKLEIQSKRMDNDSDLDIVYSDFFHFTGQADFSATGEYQNDEKFSGSGKVIIGRLLKRNVFRMNTLLIRKDSLNTHLFREELISVEDWEFWLRLACEGLRFEFLQDQQCISGVRVNPKGLSKDIPVMKKFYLPVLQLILVHYSIGFGNRFSAWMRYLNGFFDRLFKGEAIEIFPDRKRLFTAGLAWRIPVFILPYLLFKIVRR